MLIQKSVSKLSGKLKNLYSGCFQESPDKQSIKNL